MSFGSFAKAPTKAFNEDGGICQALCSLSFSFHIQTIEFLKKLLCQPIFKHFYSPQNERPTALQMYSFMIKFHKSEKETAQRVLSPSTLGPLTQSAL